MDNFLSNPTDITIQCHKLGCDTAANSDFTIRWNVYSEFRDYGIKSSTIGVHSVKGYWVAEFGEEIVFNSEENGFSIEIESDQVNFGSTIIPRAIIIDYHTKKVHIDFNHYNND